MAQSRSDRDLEQHPPQNMPPVKARQGLLGMPVLVVLVAALVLAAIVWWGVEIFGTAIAPSADQQIGDPATVEPVAPAN